MVLADAPRRGLEGGALRVLLTEDAVDVRVGRLNDRIFLAGEALAP